MKAPASPLIKPITSATATTSSTAFLIFGFTSWLAILIAELHPAENGDIFYEFTINMGVSSENQTNINAEKRHAQPIFCVYSNR